MGHSVTRIRELTSTAQIQTLMFEKMRQWIDSTGSHRNTIINRLTSDSVRAHKNKRLGDHSQSTGHVHNSMLPEGGLQGALAAQKIHVVRLLSRLSFF